MPYIETEKRPQFDRFLDRIEVIGTKGDLEYCLFKLMLVFMADKPRRFLTLSDATYAAIHVGDEFRRRFLDVRENAARKKNGDVTVNRSLRRKNSIHGMDKTQKWKTHRRQR